ncbi:hypothetical protein D3C81_1236030 [compost metagenome]
MQAVVERVGHQLCVFAESLGHLSLVVVEVALEALAALQGLLAELLGGRIFKDRLAFEAGPGLRCQGSLLQRTLGQSLKVGKSEREHHREWIAPTVALHIVDIPLLDLLERRLDLLGSVQGSCDRPGLAGLDHLAQPQNGIHLLVTGHDLLFRQGLNCWRSLCARANRRQGEEGAMRQIISEHWVPLQIQQRRACAA